MKNEYDIEALDFGTRKGSIDKLSYKQVLYNVIMQYLNNYGKFSSKYAVERIIHATRFDEAGMELKTDINKAIIDMNHEKILRWKQYQDQYGVFDFNRRIIKTKLKIKMEKWYWDELYDRIYQILSNYQLITDHNKIQKLRYKNVIGDNDDRQEYTDGSVTDHYE
jgi:hypothetical protein